MFSLNEVLESCKAPEKRLTILMDLFLEGKIDIEAFCDHYESTWNFELDEDALRPEEAQLMASLFDIVAWYTPIREDRLAYPGFQDEQKVIDATREVRDKLRHIEIE